MMTGRHHLLSGASKVTLSVVFIVLFTGLSSIAFGLSVAPDFTLTDIEGTSFSLSDFRGRVVLLEFMRTWCSKCQFEVSELIEVQNEFGDLITIISLGIDTNETDEDLRQFRDGEGTWWWPPHDWIYAKCPYSVYRENPGAYNVTSTPTMYIIDQEGFVRYRHPENGTANVVEADVLIDEIRALLTYNVTVTTSPSIDNVHFRIDGSDYFTTNGLIEVPLFHGEHQIELVDPMIEAGGNEYYFSQWGANASGSDNPLQIYVTSSRYIEVQYDTQDITSPIAEAGGDQGVNEDTLVTLDGSASTDNVGITEYTWTLLDESIQTLTGIAPNYTFMTPGVYSVTLNVTDAAGNWATDTITITVTVEVPTANAGLDVEIDEDTIVLLNGSASWDAPKAANYIWTFVDGTLQTLNGPDHEYAFTNPGVYMITLTVRDAFGTEATDSLQVTVLDVTQPIARITADSTVTQGATLEFSAESSTDNGEIVQYAWDFGDDAQGIGITMNHVYANPGDYTVKLTITDAGGNAATTEQRVSVLPNGGGINVMMWLPILIIPGVLLMFIIRRTR